ncbi:MAG: carbonic anhydrase [Chloroherpetonaceae bacterium]|nr:carbonic anhydrase [Chloroherpetonaceae bacterium]
MESYKKMLLANKAWVKECLQIREDYFERFKYEQKPEFLWIGCADSRVPAEDVVAAEPGELFVQRNIANLVIHTDFNMLSVLQFAVEVLKVKHVVLCGHYGCGGVKAAMSHRSYGLINKWLQHVKDVYRFHKTELEMIQDEKKRFDRLVELNVYEQLKNIADTSIIQRMWKKEQQPTLHGWVYDIETGLLKQLHLWEPGSEVEDIYRYDIE